MSLDKAELEFEKLDVRSKCEYLATCLRDLNEAREAIELFQTDFMLPPVHSIPLKRCLAEAAIVRYCRPFFNSEVKEDLPRIKLPESFKNFDEQQRSLHERIYAARCSLVGHSDLAYVDITQLRIRLPGAKHPIYGGTISQFKSEEIAGLEGMVSLVQELSTAINWRLQHYAVEAGEFQTKSKKIPL